jgi:hypothetical protein
LLQPEPIEIYDFSGLLPDLTAFNLSSITWAQALLLFDVLWWIYRLLNMGRVVLMLITGYEQIDHMKKPHSDVGGSVLNASVGALLCFYKCGANVAKMPKKLLDNAVGVSRRVMYFMQFLIAFFLLWLLYEVTRNLLHMGILVDIGLLRLLSAPITASAVVSNEFLASYVWTANNVQLAKSYKVG